MFLSVRNNAAWCTKFLTNRVDRCREHGYTTLGLMRLASSLPLTVILCLDNQG